MMGLGHILLTVGRGSGVSLVVRGWSLKCIASQGFGIQASLVGRLHAEGGLVVEGMRFQTHKLKPWVGLTRKTVSKSGLDNCDLTASAGKCCWLPCCNVHVRITMHLDRMPTCCLQCSDGRRLSTAPSMGTASYTVITNGPSKSFRSSTIARSQPWRKMPCHIKRCPAARC